MNTTKEALADLVEQFNEQQDSIRIVAILSSSCSECSSTYKALKGNFDRFGSSGKLKGITIWNPSSPDRENDPSISFVNDSTGQLADLFAKTLAVRNEQALHLYMLYPPRIKWEGEDQLPPSPAFWMHQASELDKKQYFDPARFEEECKFLIEAEDPDYSDKQVSDVLLNKKKKGST
jgi:hypothetical protein